MTKMWGALLSMVVLGLAGFTPAAAQNTTVDSSAVLAACRGTGAEAQAGCEQAILLYLEQLRAAGLSTDQADALLGDLVEALGTDLSALPPGTRTTIVAAIRQVSGEITDETLRINVTTVAARIEAGEDFVPEGEEETSPD